MKLKKLLEDIVPKYLYHATYEPLLSSIKKNGLNPNLGKKNWPDSRKVVYLSKDKEVAISYAETSEEVDEEWLDKIIVLRINTSKLNRNNLEIDKNVKGNKGDTLEYNGVIPFSSIDIIRAI